MLGNRVQGNGDVPCHGLQCDHLVLAVGQEPPADRTEDVVAPAGAHRRHVKGLPEVCPPSLRLALLDDRAALVLQRPDAAVLGDAAL